MCVVCCVLSVRCWLLFIVVRLLFVGYMFVRCCLFVVACWLLRVVRFVRCVVVCC